MITVGIKKLDPRATVPTQAHPGDAWDLYALEDVTLVPHSPVLAKTGLALELPANVRAWITPRSGLALKRGITVGNAPGLVDPSYRGEVGVILVWAGCQDAQWGCRTIVKAGERIAQMSMEMIPEVAVIEVNELSETARGVGAFGSTGA
jgi:dUTP pyrophosphatase